MNIYRAVGFRTDIAKGADDKVIATGCTPSAARTNLLRRHQYITGVYTELIPREERYAMLRQERAQ